MGIAKIIQLQSLISSSSSSTTTYIIIIIIINISENSMSQEYHHHQQQQQPQQNPTNQQQEETTHVSGLFGFPNGFDRSTDDPSTSSVVADLNPGYDQSAGMLSEMFNFGQGSGTGNANQSQIPPLELLDYRRTGSGILVGNNNEWYEEQHQPHPHHHQHEQHNQLNDHNSVAAMQLFITNAPPRSPSPPPPQQPPFHSMGIVNTPNNSNNPNFWGGHGQLGGIIEGQGLSLSLSSSLQHLEAAKQAEDNQIMFFNSAVGPSSVTTNDASLSHTHFFKNLSNSQPPTPHPQHHHHNPVVLQNLQPVGGYVGPSSGSMGFGSVGSTSSSLGVVNVLRNSKYSKPAQELLEEFCSVGRGHQLKKPNNKLGRQNSSNNPNSSTSGGGSGGAGGSSSSKEPPQLAPSDRIEHQRRKVKLLAMLDEVDRRYNHYCEQMQMVVNSFDLVMGYGGAIPYTALAQKAMSRHFRCLKDAIHAQVKHSCELLGEKDPTVSSGLTKGETPRLKALEQSLRQQRAFHQMGMMDQEAWRPQRGLPERSVNILRAWLFEHFLHPYPSDADKHLLARQTGLSRNQVSNWFINARVRLWKPMVEEMYQQEAKDREDNDDNNNNNDNDVDDNDDDNNEEEIKSQNPPPIAQNPMPSYSTSASTSTMLSNEPQKSANDSKIPTLLDSDPSQLAPINNRLPNQQQQHLHFHSQHADVFELPDSGDAGPTTMIRFGGPAPTGDVSLTLGLRHSGNAPENPFSVRDFGS